MKSSRLINVKLLSTNVSKFTQLVAVARYVIGDGLAASANYTVNYSCTTAVQQYWLVLSPQYTYVAIVLVNTPVFV